MSSPAPVVLAIQGGYAGLTFGWRTWLQWRSTGDTGFRLSPSAPVRDRVASGLMVAGAVVGLVGTASAARRRVPGGRLAPLGVAAVAAGVATTYRAQLDMGASWRVGVDHEERTDLVDTGLFRWSRNPIFASMSAVALGSALAVPTATTALGAAMVVAGVEVQVRAVEEPYLLRTHGDPYRRYAGRTGRFVPGVGLLR